MDARADDVAVLQAQIEVMGQKMQELQLTMAEKMDAQDAPDDDQFVKVTKEKLKLKG